MMAMKQNPFSYINYTLTRDMKFFILVVCLFTFGVCQFEKRFVGSRFNKLYVFNGTFQNNKESSELCEQHGANLIQPNSRAELDFFESRIGDSWFWVGARAETQRYPFKFTDGSDIG